VRIIFSIMFGVVFGLLGARLAGWLADLIQMEKRFESPDQVAQFRLIAEVSITVLVALLGVLIGLLVARTLRHHLIQKDV
jgi:hypothetical protein